MKDSQPTSVSAQDPNGALDETVSVRTDLLEGSTSDDPSTYDCKTVEGRAYLLQYRLALSLLRKVSEGETEQLLSSSMARAEEWGWISAEHTRTVHYACVVLDRGREVLAREEASRVGSSE